MCLITLRLRTSTSVSWSDRGVNTSQFMKDCRAGVDPIRDLDTILQELCKKDLAYVQAQRAMKERDVKRTPNAKLPPIFFSVMDKVEKLLEDTKGLAGAEWTPVEVEKINELIPQAITLKPVVYLINMSKKDYVRKKNKWLLKIKQWIDAHHPGIMIPVSVDFEQVCFADCCPSY